MEARRFLGPWLGVLLAGITLLVVGYDLIGVCTRFAYLSRDCVESGYAPWGLVLMLVGMGLAIAGLGLTAYPSARVLPSTPDVPLSSPTTPAERRFLRRTWTLFSIMLLAGLLLVEFFLIRDVPVGYQLPGGDFVYYPAFLWSLVPIVVSNSFVAFMVWSYLARR